MLYLLDSNVLITANNMYYALDQVPEFWEWLQYHGEIGNIKIPIEIFEEVKFGRREKDLLFDWINEVHIKEALLLEEEVDIELVQRGVREGYADDLSDHEVEQLGRDPFLIAYGMVEGARCIVTTEVSKPSKERHNRKIPDVCSSLGVNCCDTFSLTRELEFRTSWNR